MSAQTGQSVADLQKASLESAMRLAQMSVETSQRILQVQAEAAKNLFEDCLANVRELAAAKTPQEAMELRMRFAQQTAQKVLESGRNVGEITAKLQAEMTQMVSAQFGQGQNGMVELMQGVMKNLPMNGQAASDAFTQALGAAQQMLAQLTQASTSAFTAAVGDAQKAAHKRDSA